MIEKKFESFELPVNPTQAICSQVYFEGDKACITNEFISKLKGFTNYEKSPLFAPLLYIVALAALGRHEKGRTSPKPKFLKTILTTEEDLKNLVINASDKTIGNYRFKSSIFAALGEGSDLTQNNLSNIFHEMMHFIALEVMKNYSKPYENNALIANQFRSIREEIRQNIRCKLIEKFSPDEKEIFSSFTTLFDRYKANSWDSELIVLFGETMGILGYENGCNFLQTHFPEFMNFYTSYFYPKCIDYLREQKVENFIDVGPEFLIPLKGAADQDVSKPSMG